MRRGSPSLPDWRDPAGYAGLLEASPQAMAWEWLRRDARYHDAARAAVSMDADRSAHEGARIVPADPGAARWGLHAFEDPGLPAARARPVWRRAAFPATLVAAVESDAEGVRSGAVRHAAADHFDLARFAAMATIVRGAGDAEHLLLAEGLAGLRLDVAAGSLLEGPVRLSYRLTGLAALEGPLATLHALVRLCRSGHLPRVPPRGRNRRLVLLLRAYDALQGGAAQREIAAALLSADAARARWRTEVPSLRLQAQRLAGGARAMARGGYRALLGA